MAIWNNPVPKYDQQVCVGYAQVGSNIKKFTLPLPLTEQVPFGYHTGGIRTEKYAHTSDSTHGKHYSIGLLSLVCACPY